MNVTCFYDQTPFTLSMEEKIAALRKMHAENLHHYDARCPRCGRANAISRERLEMFTPGWEEAIKAPAAAPMESAQSGMMPSAQMPSVMPASPMTAPAKKAQAKKAPSRRRHAPAAKRTAKKAAPKKAAKKALKKAARKAPKPKPRKTAKKAVRKAARPGGRKR
jgi:hypothetical protein